MKTTWLHDFFDLFFPRLCLACEHRQPSEDAVLCLSCQIGLPETGMHEMSENRFMDRFYGRVYLQAGAALYHYKKGGGVQNLIHKLKYRGKQIIGEKLGTYYGKQLLNSGNFSDIDLIVPVPLHPLKKKKRGYNQSDKFAAGLARSMQKPWVENGLIRTQYTESQARKNRKERYGEIMNSFQVNRGDLITGKHILLVDDVLTTGATLEACAHKILKVSDTKLSMLTIAIAGTT